jgi:hypothetical protein
MKEKTTIIYNNPLMDLDITNLSVEISYLALSIITVYITIAYLVPIYYAGLMNIMMTTYSS